MIRALEPDKDYIIRADKNGIVDDVVEGVRCKDCEFYTEEERWCRRLGLCGAFHPNDYCSHGERRENETN